MYLDKKITTEKCNHEIVMLLECDELNCECDCECFICGEEFSCGYSELSSRLVYEYHSILELHWVYSMLTFISQRYSKMESIDIAKIFLSMSSQSECEYEAELAPIVNNLEDVADYRMSYKKKTKFIN